MAHLPPPLGQSPAFHAHIDHLSRVAPLDRPVLLIGERGTGKELSAARVHFLSKRWSGPFVKLNCAALPENLLEAELFGVEPGAFTGAGKRRLGRFELADGGTLLLDEIGNAPLAVQEKILRVIEYGELERLGASETQTVSVRVIGATNADLPGMARAGKFREDLLDRLAFDVLTLPPLRAREGDVATLADHFGRAMAAELGWDAFPGFTPAAAERLVRCSWPGNVRELKNVVERAVAHCADPTRAIESVQFDPFASPHRMQTHKSSEEVAPPVAAPTFVQEGSTPDALPDDFRGAVRAFGRDLLSRALAEARHNQRAAAQRLGLTYHQYRNLLKTHGLSEARRSS